MKKILFNVIGVLLVVVAVLLGIGGVIGGLYMGLYYGLYGGICAVIDAAQKAPIVGSDIAWGVIRIIFAGLMGWATCLVSWIAAFAVGKFGAYLCHNADNTRRDYRR